MATAGRFNIYRKLGNEAAVMVFNINPTLTYREGDMLHFDKASGRVLPIAAEADVLNYVGIALATNPVAHHPKPITKMAVFIGDVIAKMFMPAGQAIAHMTPVYATADAQTVTIVDPGAGNVLGYTIMDAEEFKQPRNTVAGEEVSILLRASIILTRQF